MGLFMIVSFLYFFFKIKGAYKQESKEKKTSSVSIIVWSISTLVLITLLLHNLAKPITFYIYEDNRRKGESEGAWEQLIASF